MHKLRRLFLVGLLLASTGAAALAQQAVLDGFDGEFRGSVPAAGGEPGGDFTVVIQRTGSGFTVSWPTRGPVHFEPAGRPGVYVAKTNSRPLDGAPVYWARVTGRSLIVYSLQIGDRGGYHIDNFAYTPIKDGLKVVIHHVRSGAEPVLSRGRLARYGP